MDRQPTLEGPTLLLRPLDRADFDELFAIASDRELWAQHPAHDRWQEPVFRAFFADALAQGGALVAIDKATGKIVGSSRFQAYDPADGGSVEIGWTFIARERWGDGTNREMKRLMVAHALESVTRAIFRVGETNFRSRRALEKIGAVRTNRRKFVAMNGSEIPHLEYEISAADT